MGSVDLQDTADERPTERRMVVSCLLCHAEMICPPDVDEWGWVRSDPVKTFASEHLAHGSRNTVGAYFKYIEKKD